MNRHVRKLNRYASSLNLAVTTLLLFTLSAIGQNRAGVLRGRVTDESGAVIVRATVELIDAKKTKRTVLTNDAGTYLIPSLAPGTYAARVEASGFIAYETYLVITVGRNAHDFSLGVALDTVHVEVTDSIEQDLSAAASASRVVLRDERVAALPEDARSRVAVLQALAGPPIDLAGREVIVDGFSAGRVPPRDSIREVRINQDPFAAEFERHGAGRIEILTKGGTDKFRSAGFFNFADAALNSRYPFAPARVPYRQQLYGGNVSGPLLGKKLSFFLDAERRVTTENAVVNATVLDDQLAILPVRESVLTPDRTFTYSPRLDFQINRRHQLIARYSYNNSLQENLGVGGFSLSSRGFERVNAEHAVRLTESGRYGVSIFNETRFQYLMRRNRQSGDAREPTLRVLDAFTGGGSHIGKSLTNEDRWELHNHSTKAFTRHILRLGARLRHMTLTDISSQNFSGQCTFAGGIAPQLDARGDIIRDAATGAPILVSISSLERYQRTLLLQHLGLAAAEIRLRGGGATQFSIAGGNPAAAVAQTDLSLFVQDEWRIRPRFVLNAGLRYESQTNITSNLNFAPRLGFAWSPNFGTRFSDAKSDDKSNTVVRGGFGIFYERFGESFTLQERRFNDPDRQRQFVVTDPDVLNLFPRVPSVANLTAFAIPQSPWRIADEVQTPYMLLGQASVERRLPHSTTFTATYSRSRALRLLRSRNINAPLSATFGADEQGVRPMGDIGNIFQFESSGRFDQHRLALTVDSRPIKRTNFFASYVLSESNSDTDGAWTFPVNSYDLRGEYGRASTAIRHTFTLNGSINAGFGFTLNPFVVASSGRPFNIITGFDQNGDTIFAERPAFARDPGVPGIVRTELGDFDLNPPEGTTLIPRNYATGPGFLLVNLRIGKTYNAERFGDLLAAWLSSGKRKADAKTKTPLSVSFSVQIQNLLNRTNLNQPSGNLRSPQFNTSNSIAAGYGYIDEPSAGNRRLEAQIRLSF